METMTTVQGRAQHATRRPARRAHAAARHITGQPRSMRARVAMAFRDMAHGVGGKAAWASTIAFYRSGGQAWTQRLA